MFFSDVPLSYGILDATVDPRKLNEIQVVWDPTKDTGVYVKVHCISTEFTPKKHGGEKGVPFRIKVQSYTHGDGECKLLHCASSQIKVFKVGITAVRFTPFSTYCSHISKIKQGIDR